MTQVVPLFHPAHPHLYLLTLNRSVGYVRLIGEGSRLGEGCGDERLNWRIGDTKRSKLVNRESR